mgnify:CR=1 FL=1
MQGPRSHAAEMSGGDLDGDTFWICTEKELIFEQNRQPFTYIDQAVEAEKKAKAQSNTTYTINDVCDFFGEYIEADKFVFNEMKFLYFIFIRSLIFSVLDLLLIVI